MSKFPCPCWGLPGGSCWLCNGSGQADDIQFSQNFHFSELVVTSEANKRVPNIPSKDDIERLRRLCQELLQPARNELGPLLVNSGFRSQQLDHLIAPYFKGLSGHSIGAAADVRSPTKKLVEVMNWFYDAKAKGKIKYDQLILEGGCVHVAVLSPYPVGNNNVQRGHSLVRVMGPGGNAFAYEPYDPKSGSQLLRVR